MLLGSLRPARSQANPPSHAALSTLRQPTHGSDDALAPGGPMSPTNAPSKTPADREFSTIDAAGPAGRRSHPPLPKRPAPPATPAANPPPTPTEPVEEKRQKGYYRCKVRHAILYAQLFPIWEGLTTDERLLESMHGWSSQCNEALNTAVAKYARKGRTYCTTMSLTNRVMICMGIHNLGYYEYWSRVFISLNMFLSPALSRYLQQKDKNKSRKRKYEATPERKKKRAKGKHEKMKKEIQKQIADFNRGATYGTGIAMEAQESLPSFVLEDEQRKKRLKSQRCPLPGCLGRNHATSGSRACKYFDCKNDVEFFEELKKYLLLTYPDKYGEYTK